MKTLFFPSSFGTLRLRASEKGLCELHILVLGEKASGISESSMLLEKARKQLEDYFKGVLHVFDIPLDLGGTPFQQAVWAELRRIPYGETVSYGEIARRIGRPKAVRAVGGANHRNPVAIIVPCHRVIGSDGRLVGYGGGLELKERLLEHERHYSRLL